MNKPKLPPEPQAVPSLALKAIKSPSTPAQGVRAAAPAPAASTTISGQHLAVPLGPLLGADAPAAENPQLGRRTPAPGPATFVPTASSGAITSPGLPPLEPTAIPVSGPSRGGALSPIALNQPVASGPSGLRAISNPPSQRTPSGERYTHQDGPTVDPEPGTRIHHYEIIKLLGRGGMGSVFLARDTRLGRKVAIKFLRTQSAELTRRFILEARTTAACSHENIVVIHEVDAWQGSPFMVFEFLSGQTLTRLVPDDHRPLPPPRVVELLYPVVKALAYAHGQGVVHRDLKPDNILVTDSGITKVLDFGIAKVLQGDEQAPAMVARPRAPVSSLDDEDDSSAELTQKGAMMGTLSYMAPEQWGIGVPIDHRADIWSVGIMLFRMLSGRHPLDPLKGPQLMITGVLDTPMPTLSSKAPQVPADLAAVVDRCLMKRKEQRWPDATALLKALEAFLPGRRSNPELPLDESPYPGLSAFQEADAGRFFGRAREVVATVNRIRERPLVAVVGPSGAGKSSFVRAGLVPALKRSGEAWEALVLRPGRAPLSGLASLVAPFLTTSTSVVLELEEQKQIAGRIAAEPGFVGAVLRARARREKKNLLLFVDQFEELYTNVADPKERQAFTAALAGVADDPTSPIRLVVSLRSDFLDRVPEDPQFMAELSLGLVFLSAPGAEGLKEALVAPAELAGYAFETPTIVEDMLRHLATTQGALPLLQFTASRLWESRDAGRKLLTEAAYAGMGGVAGALASHADAVLSRLPPRSTPLVRSVFLRLVTPEGTRALVSLDELKELHPDRQELQAVLDELVQARLLTVQTGGGAATVEIVHESLVASWPTLKRWLEENGEDAAFVEQVRQAARQWQQKNRADDLLWRGELADEAERFRRRYRGPLTDVQQGFLEAVSKKKRGEAVRRRALTVGVVTFLLALVAASLVALMVIRRARDQAEEQARVATAAEGRARLKQQEAEQKEQERAAAAAEADRQRKVADKRAAEALQAAEEADRSARAAIEAEEKAGKNAAAATRARRVADEARQRATRLAEDLKRNLEKERERAKALEEASGSPVIENLK